MASVFAEKGTKRPHSGRSPRFPPKSSLKPRAHNARVNPRKSPKIRVIHNFHRIIHILMSTPLSAKNVEICPCATLAFAMERFFNFVNLPT